MNRSARRRRQKFSMYQASVYVKTAARLRFPVALLERITHAGDETPVSGEALARAKRRLQ